MIPESINPPEHSVPEHSEYVRVLAAFGIHGRVAAGISRCSGLFPDTEIVISTKDKSASCGSLVQLLLLAVSVGERVKVSARGPQAHDAVQAVAAVLEDSPVSDLNRAALSGAEIINQALKTLSDEKSPYELSIAAAMLLTDLGVAHPEAVRYFENIICHNSTAPNQVWFPNERAELARKYLARIRANAEFTCAANDTASVIEQLSKSISAADEGLASFGILFDSRDQVVFAVRPYLKISEVALVHYIEPVPDIPTGYYTGWHARDRHFAEVGYESQVRKLEAQGWRQTNKVRDILNRHSSIWEKKTTTAIRGDDVLAALELADVWFRCTLKGEPHNSEGFIRIDPPVDPLKYLQARRQANKRTNADLACLESALLEDLIGLQLLLSASKIPDKQLVLAAQLEEVVLKQCRLEEIPSTLRELTNKQ